MSRLKSQKQKVETHIDQLKGAVRFDMPEGDEPVDDAVLDETSAPTDLPKKTEEPKISGGKAEPESYTERLLKAKRKAWDDKDKKK